MCLGAPDMPGKPKSFQESQTPAYRGPAQQGTSTGRRGTILTAASPQLTPSATGAKKTLLGA